MPSEKPAFGLLTHPALPSVTRTRKGAADGADSIDDLDLLRHGAMPALSGGVRAPSTLGSFPRSFTWGNVLQLQKVSRLVLAELACRAPLPPRSRGRACRCGARGGRLGGCCSAEQYPVSECFHPVGGQVCVGR
jgi:hypothetical protein